MILKRYKNFSFNFSFNFIFRIFTIVLGFPIFSPFLIWLWATLPNLVCICSPLTLIRTPHGIFVWAYGKQMSFVPPRFVFYNCIFPFLYFRSRSSRRPRPTSLRHYVVTFGGTAHSAIRARARREEGRRRHIVVTT
jgi:hypothetical protein